jgi:putative glycosyltransferase (TIGR04372 family)
MRPFKRHIEEIRKGGKAVFLRKLKRFFLSRIPLILLSPIAVTVLLIIRLIRPWIHVRFGYFVHTRIGHFAPDVGLALAERELNIANCYSDWFFLPRKTCNQQWAKMVKRNFRVQWWVESLYYWNLTIPGGEAHFRHPGADTVGSRDRKGWFSKTSTKMHFLKEEEITTKAWLRNQGWQDGDPFVCLLVRDAAYLEQNSLHKWSEEKQKYHDYRNSDISTYVQAAEYLAQNDIWVLRMGKEMNYPILSKHPKVIDYAFHQEKNDLLDIWLFANCTFCISTSTGPDGVAAVYNRPFVFVNSLPLAHLWGGDSIWVPKHLIWEKTGKYLTLKDHLKHCYFRTHYFENSGIGVVDLSPTEIAEAVQERLMRIQGTWIELKEDIELQNRFWKQLKNWSKFSKYHEWIHPELRVGASYLRKMGEAFYE